MSCQKCEDFRDKGYQSFFRWKNANIEINGCPEHLREIFEVLREAQKPKNPIDIKDKGGAKMVL